MTNKQVIKLIVTELFIILGSYLLYSPGNFHVEGLAILMTGLIFIDKNWKEK